MFLWAMASNQVYMDIPLYRGYISDITIVIYQRIADIFDSPKIVQCQWLPRPHIAERDPGRQPLFRAAHVGAVHVGPREGTRWHGAEPLVAWEPRLGMGKS